MLTLLLASRNPANKTKLAERPTRIQDQSANNWLYDYLCGLPDIDGGPIRLQFLPELTAHRGKLLTGATGRGRAVYAASFLRERRIVLDDALIQHPPLLRLMLTHEIFHFVWIRLSNESRQGFERTLVREQRAGVTCDLGESSEVARESLRPGDRARRSLPWRNYVCESFCDTGTWMYSGVRRHRCFRLAEEWRNRRAAFFFNIPTLRA